MGFLTRGSNSNNNINIYTFCGFICYLCMWLKKAVIKWDIHSGIKSNEFPEKIYDNSILYITMRNCEKQKLVLNLNINNSLTV